MLTNTDKFRQPALHFEEHGIYTKFPRTSRSYYNFWKEEKRRCIDGFEAEDGSFISGYFYFYLNYCPIYVTIPKDSNVQIELRDFLDSGMEIMTILII